MLGATCNINQTDRINRILIGAVLIIGTLLGAGKIFVIVIASILVIEGSIGWCSIPYALSWFKRNKSDQKINR